MLFSRNRFHTMNYHIVKHIIQKDFCLQILLVFILISPSASAQDWNKELVAINKAYQANPLFLQMTTTQHEESLDKVVSKEITVLYKRGENIYYKTSESEIIVDEKMILAIDHEGKQMSYNERPEAEEEALAKLTQPGQLSEAWADSFESQKYVGEKNGLKHYQFENPKGMIAKVDVYIDTKFNICRKLRYAYNEELYGKYWVTINVDKFDTSPTIDNKLFEIKYYLLSNGDNTYKPVAKYGTYTVIQPK